VKSIINCVERLKICIRQVEAEDANGQVMIPAFKLKLRILK